MDYNEFDNEKLNKDEMTVNEPIESAQDNVMIEENGSGKKRRKKPGFFGGLIIGVVLSISILAGSVLAYCKISGQYMVIGMSNKLGNSQTASAGAGDQTELLDTDTVSKLNELTKYIDLYYYDEYNVSDLKDGMYAGLVDALGDKYTVYYTAEEYQDLQISTTGTYYGIGAGLAQNKDTMVVTVSKVYSGTPAEEAGLMQGDVIMSADGNDAASMEVSDLVQIIRGEEGTTVSLEVYRESTGETFTVDVERRNVELPSVEGQMLDGGIGYIQIAEFQSKTADQFNDILTDLESQGMKGLIVDVRSNPGGLLTSVVDILDRLLPEGTVVYTEDKYGNREDYTSDASCVDYPIVVLCDENSASAAEIFSGAMQDYNCATLVGTTTFGKGIVQTIFPLSDGDALKVTTAKYFTPNGSYIHGVGITPDIEIDYEYGDPEGTVYDMQYDNQLQKAIEVMNEKLTE